MNSSDKSLVPDLAKRLVLGLIFVTSAMFLAFVAGAWVYSIFLSPSRGFVGGAEVFVSGIATALGIGILSAFYALRMSPEKLSIAAAGAFLIAVTVMAVFYFQLIPSA